MDWAWGLLSLLVFPGFAFVIALSFVYEWYDRKLYADIQRRVGPLYTGPLGVLQPFADFVKLMSKEDLTPRHSDRKVFNAVPIIMAALMLTALMMIPITGISGLISFSGDVVFAIVVMTFFCILVFLAGFSSMSRYSIIGAERAVLQLLGFEIPMMLSMVGACIFSGSVTISGIVAHQSGLWNVVGPQALSFVIFLIAAQAELERVPFDMPEAEQEIVAGWQTEYSGRKLALIRLARNLELVFIAGIAAALYLGGPLGPSTDALSPAIFPIYFIAKTLFVIMILTVMKSVFARVRIDQMVSFAWQYLIPLSLVQIMITLIWRAV